MSVSKPWKELERRIARLLKGLRLWRPDYSESLPDGETDDLTWDAKCYAAIAVIAWYVECEKKYRDYTGDRQFLLALFSRRHNRAGDFFLVPAKHYAELREKAGGDVR